MFVLCPLSAIFIANVLLFCIVIVTVTFPFRAERRFQHEQQPRRGRAAAAERAAHQRHGAAADGDGDPLHEDLLARAGPRHPGRG